MAVIVGCGSEKTSGEKNKVNSPPPHASKIKPAPKPLDNAQAARDVFLKPQPGMSLEELAKNKANAAKINDPNYEVAPGLKLGQVKARHAEAVKKMQDPNTQVYPGLTVGEIQKKKDKDAQAYGKNMQNPKNEIFPGLTLSGIRDRQAAAAKKMESAQPEVLPGVNLSQKKAQAQAAQKSSQEDTRLMDMYPPVKK
jgi:hypothetical protein